MNLDLKSIELFIRVATLGAIGKAGSEFGLSPTATTQRIQALETAVGTQLIHRTTRAVSLSADGEAFLDHARKIIADVEDALADIQYEPQSIRGELRIAAPASFGRIHVAPYIAEFIDLHPNVSIQLHLTDSVIDIVEQGIDLAIRLGALQSSTLKARKLAESPRMIVAAPGYIARHGQPEFPEDLQDHNCLAREDMRTWKMTGPDADDYEIKISGNFASNSAEAVTEAALTGLGIARKCRWEVAEHLKSGALVPLLSDYTITPEWNVYALRSPSRLTPARVRAFGDFLGQKLRSIPALSNHKPD